MKKACSPARGGKGLFLLFNPKSGSCNNPATPTNTTDNQLVAFLFSDNFPIFTNGSITYLTLKYRYLKLLFWIQPNEAQN
jgi:hypothetical protein